MPVNLVKQADLEVKEKMACPDYPVRKVNRDSLEIRAFLAYQEEPDQLANAVLTAFQVSTVSQVQRVFQVWPEILAHLVVYCLQVTLLSVTARPIDHRLVHRVVVASGKATVFCTSRATNAPTAKILVRAGRACSDSTRCRSFSATSTTSAITPAETTSRSGCRRRHRCR